MTKLQIPCSYQGGKQKIAGEIVDIFFNREKIDDNTKFYDLCCGSGSVSVELINRGVNPQNITMIDSSVWGVLWRSIGEGKFDIDRFEKLLLEIPSDVAKVKSYMDNLAKKNPTIDTEYVFLILQSASFGGKALWIEEDRWKTQGFRDYWLPTETSIRRSPVNPMSPMPETLLNRVKELVVKAVGVKGIHENVFNFNKFSENSLIYIDPPYANTTGYGHSIDILEYVRKIDKKIYVSEGKKISDSAIEISKSKKSGITGKRKSPNEEWINIFNE